MNNLINRVINCITLACIFTFLCGIAFTIGHYLSRGRTQDEALAMITFIIIPFVLNYIVGNGIKLFNRRA